MVDVITAGLNCSNSASCLTVKSRLPLSAFVIIYPSKMLGVLSVHKNEPQALPTTPPPGPGDRPKPGTPEKL
jgi:hypothetical protein